MNAGVMAQYIEFVADRLLVSLGYRKVRRDRLAGCPSRAARILDVHGCTVISRSLLRLDFLTPDSKGSAVRSSFTSLHVLGHRDLAHVDVNTLPLHPL